MCMMRAGSGCGRRESLSSKSSSARHTLLGASLAAQRPQQRTCRPSARAKACLACRHALPGPAWRSSSSSGRSSGRAAAAASAAAPAAGGGEQQLQQEEEQQQAGVDDAAAAWWAPPSADEQPGPAVRDTLGMLEWPRLCGYLAQHASTALGKRLCQRLPVPLDAGTSTRLLTETRAMLELENTYTAMLDFGGINTALAEEAIKRATKGGMVAGPQLRGLVTLLEGADRLKRQVGLVARQARARGAEGPLRPLLAVVGAVAVPRALMTAVCSAVQEDGSVADTASEAVRTTRGRVRALTGRINSILKPYPGEASEKGGRMCVAVPTGTKVANGVLLGTSVGGGLSFIEPGQVVALNNELASARAEALAAEESVLWDLSTRLMACLEDVTTAFDAVAWLDVTAARLRFGLWLGGVLPELVPWEQVFAARGAAPQHAADDATAGAAAAAAPDARWRAQQPPALQLRGLSHPLLLCDYVARRQRLEQQLRLQPGGGAAAAGPGGKAMSSRLLGTRKEVMARRLSASEAAALLASAEQAQDGDAGPGSELSLEQQLAQLAPPRPIDLVVEAHTSVIVITGPNTGGKTAAMKALGLAVLMAKAGMMLPAAAPARLPCFSRVLADIGDEQSLTANLSTFSGHLRRITAVRGEADATSLLLLDELGTGTDPVEGAALGLALLKQLVQGGSANGALTVATTHHAVLTGLKFDDAAGRVENASVEFDEAALAPTYRLLWGVPGRSNALNIAARLGLGQDIVAAARGRLAAGVAAANAAIAELEQLQEEATAQDAAAFAVQAGIAESKHRLAQLRDLVASQRSELLLARSAALQEAAAAARPLLKALRAERKARLKGNLHSRVGRQLDAALGESFAAPAADKLESAIQAFQALSGDAAAFGGQGGAAAAQQQQQQQQQWMQQEEWVRTWARLLAAARATLSVSLSAGSGGGGGSGLALPDDDAQLEAELSALQSRAQAAAAKAEAERLAAQQLLEEVWHTGRRQQRQQQQQHNAPEQPGEAAAAREAPHSAEAATGQEQLQQQPSQRRRAASLDAQVQQELFADGVRLIEEALDEDPRLQQALDQQAAAARAAAAQAAAEAAQQRAAMAAMERELEQWAAVVEAQQQQQAQAQAQQAQQQAHAQQQAQAQQQQQRSKQQQHKQPPVDLGLVAAIEGLQLPGGGAGSASSQRAAAAAAAGAPPRAAAAPGAGQRSAGQRSGGSSSSSSSGGGGGGVDELLAFMDDLDSQAQLQQQIQAAEAASPLQQQRSKGKKKKKQGKDPVFKFKL